MKWVFISHPYKDDPKGNKKLVDTICRELAKKDDILPISPLHLFSFMEDDEKREEILQVCYRLIDICDEVWIYGDSEGCKREAEYAQRAGGRCELCGKRGTDTHHLAGRSPLKVYHLPEFLVYLCRNCHRRFHGG